jgi:hypothetical protein
LTSSRLLPKGENLDMADRTRKLDARNTPAAVGQPPLRLNRHTLFCCTALASSILFSGLALADVTGTPGTNGNNVVGLSDTATLITVDPAGNIAIATSGDDGNGTVGTAGGAIAGGAGGAGTPGGPSGNGGPGDS